MKSIFLKYSSSADITPLRRSLYITHQMTVRSLSLDLFTISLSFYPRTVRIKLNSVNLSKELPDQTSLIGLTLLHLSLNVLSTLRLTFTGGTALSDVTSTFHQLLLIPPGILNLLKRLGGRMNLFVLDNFRRRLAKSELST